MPTIQQDPVEAINSAKNYYERLGADRSFSEKDLHTAYLRIARTVHPDQVTDAVEKERRDDATALLTEAYTTLKDATKRAEYDARLPKGFVAAPQPDVSLNQSMGSRDQSRSNTARSYFDVSLVTLRSHGPGNLRLEIGERANELSLAGNTSKEVQGNGQLLVYITSDSVLSVGKGVKVIVSLQDGSIAGEIQNSGSTLNVVTGNIELELKSPFRLLASTRTGSVEAKNLEFRSGFYIPTGEPSVGTLILSTGNGNIRTTFSRK